MSTARHMIALLKSHLEGDDREFLSVAMQAAAHEARLGHGAVAQQVPDLIDEAKRRVAAGQKGPGHVVVLEPRGELAHLLSVETPTLRLADMSLPPGLAERLHRVLVEQRQKKRLREHALQPRRKLLFTGPPGSGKTMTASALAGELHLPLYTIMLEGLITKFMGETAAKLKSVFDTTRQRRGVYLFDEFDALGAHRSQTNDVGEIRRVLNSFEEHAQNGAGRRLDRCVLLHCWPAAHAALCAFLQLLEKDGSDSIIVAATNHPQMLDRAPFRRFDDVIEYTYPDTGLAKDILVRKLAMFDTSNVIWTAVLPEADGLSQAELVRAAEEAAKQAVLGGSKRITPEALVSAILERKMASR